MENGYRKISPQEAKAIMDEHPDCLILDVREEAEYILGHVDEAVPFTLAEINAESAAEVIPDKGALLLVYCRTGRRSREAAELLLGLGYTNLYDFGGLQDWPYDLAW